MSITRFTDPIPPGAIVMHIWEQVKSLSIANPYSRLAGDIGEAYYIITADGTTTDDGVILGVATDELCQELDEIIATAEEEMRANDRD